MTTAEPLSHDKRQAPSPGVVHDPVCGMTVETAKARHRVEHAGQSYSFCSARCREKFVSDPARYIVSSPPGRGRSSAGR